jgi:perosamine synthetase
MIPVNEPLLDGREKELLERCIETGWISSEGPFVREFEKSFASFVGVKHGVAVCNGTAALEAALYTAGIKRGDEVIMPTFTIISCAIAALRVGARPVLVDIEPGTWCMDTGQIESRITPKTRAIMPVHIYGHPVDMEPVLELARKYNLMVVEDAAEVHGAEYKGKRCGGLGHVAAFSFYANKIITTGEGGMVVTDNEHMAERARAYRNLSFHPDRRFYHTELGYNFRMTNLQAAVGVAQMDRIEEFIEKKRAMAACYRQALSGVPGVRLQAEKPWARSVYWMYAIELADETHLTADEMIKELKRRAIGSRPFFLGLHEQPVLKEMGLFTGESYPVAERAYRQGLYLPSGLTLTEAQVHEVSAAVKEIIQTRR